MLVAAPLLLAAAFGQLPWQVDSTTGSTALAGSSAAPTASTVASAASPAASTPAVVTVVIAPTENAAPASPPVASPANAASSTAIASVPATAKVGGALAVGSAVETTAGINERAAPGLAAAVQRVLPLGTRLTITEGPVTADGHAWYRVKAAAGAGWVAGDFLAAPVG